MRDMESFHPQKRSDTVQESLVRPTVVNISPPKPIKNMDRGDCLFKQKDNKA